MKHLVALVLFGVGCGGSGGSSSGAPPAGDPLPPVLTFLEIVPGLVEIDLEGPTAAVLTVLATYSDGTKESMVASWTTPNPAFISLGADIGTSTTVSAVSEGTAQVTAMLGALTAHATVNVSWAIPAEVGTVYGVSGNGPGVYGVIPGPSIIRYNGDGSGTPDILLTDDALGSSMGSALARDRSALYVLSGNSLYALDLSDNTWAPLATGAVYAACEGLDTDAEGRLFGHSTTAQTLYQFDVATGAVVDSWSYGVPINRVMTFQMGPDGAAYYFSYMVGVHRHDLATGSITLYHTGGGWSNNSGIAMDLKGNLFTSDLFGPSVFKSQDLNGDRDADDLGESVVFADIAFLWEAWTMINDMAIAPGGTLLINAVGLGGDYAPEGVTGLYWARDLDRSGTVTDDVGGLIRLNPQYVDTYDMDKISAIR